MLGPEPIALLRLLTGGLETLNLRNLLWHGFMKQDEFNPIFTSLIFFIILSFPQRLYDVLQQNEVRAYKSTVEYDHLLSDFGHPLSIFGEFSKEDYQEVSTLFKSSFFIVSGHLPNWEQGLEFYARKEYINCLLSFLPEIEHGIRRIYVCANSCSEQLFSAEPHTLYSTLDILLAYPLRNRNRILLEGEEGFAKQEVSQDDCKINAFYSQPEKWISTQLLSAILDIFFWFPKPRIRDSLAHGAHSHFGVAPYIVQRCLALCIGLASYYSYGEENFVNQLLKEDKIRTASKMRTGLPNASSYEFDPRIGIIQNSLNFLKNYQSYFNIKRQIQRKLVRIFSMWKSWQKSFTEEPFDFSIDKKKLWEQSKRGLFTFSNQL